jgi:hypothetical protein
MPADWHKLCRAPDLEILGDTVVVRFQESARRQIVQVRETEDAYELQSVASRLGTESPAEHTARALRIWQRNRRARLVAFRIEGDRRGLRLVGEAWAPKAGLTAEEMQMYVRRLAAEADRMEYLMTGDDRE